MDNKYGQAAGLPQRLEAWIERLGKDKTLSFPGLGLIDDLRAAAALLADKPIPAAKPAPVLEFDL